MSGMERETVSLRSICNKYARIVTVTAPGHERASGRNQMDGARGSIDEPGESTCPTGFSLVGEMF